MVPLNTLMELFEGPAILVQKRNVKLLDYDRIYGKAEKNKDNRVVSDFLTKCLCTNTGLYVETITSYNFDMFHSVQDFFLFSFCLIRTVVWDVIVH